MYGFNFLIIEGLILTDPLFGEALVSSSYYFSFLPGDLDFNVGKASILSSYPHLIFLPLMEGIGFRGFNKNSISLFKLFIASKGPKFPFANVS